MTNKPNKTNIFVWNNKKKDIKIPRICPYCSQSGSERTNVRIYKHQESSSTEIFLFGLLYPLFHSIAGTDYLDSKKILSV